MALSIFQLLDLKKGFSLPLWVTGAAKSAVKKLTGLSFVDYEKIIYDFALLRNNWLGITKALDQKQWQITNITKLRVAGMEDATL